MSAGSCGDCSRCTCFCTSVGLLWAVDVFSAILGVGLISAAVVLGDIPAVAVIVPTSVTTFAIVIGVIVLLSAGVGLIGVCKAPQLEEEKQKGNWPLRIFAITSFLISIALLVALGLAGDLISNNDSPASNNLLTSNFKSDSTKWITLQEKLSCCGFMNEPSLSTGALCPTLSPTPYIDSTFPIPNQTFYVNVSISFSLGVYFTSPGLVPVSYSAKQIGNLTFTYIKIDAYSGIIAGTPDDRALNSEITLEITAKYSGNRSDLIKRFAIFVTEEPSPVPTPVAPVVVGPKDCRALIVAEVQNQTSLILGVLLSLLAVVGLGLGAAIAMICGCACGSGPRNTDSGIDMGSKQKLDDDGPKRGCCPTRKGPQEVAPKAVQREFTFSGKSKAG